MPVRVLCCQTVLAGTLPLPTSVQGSLGLSPLLIVVYIIILYYEMSCDSQVNGHHVGCTLGISLRKPWI